MSFISSFDIITVVLCEAESKGSLPDPMIFLCTTASAAYATAVNHNGIKTLLANGVITLFIHCNPVFSKGLRSLPRNPPNCTNLDN